MNRSVQFISMTLAVIFSVSSIGCGQGFKTSGAPQAKTGDSGGLSTGTEISTSLKKAEEAAASAQVAINEANDALKEIQDESGNINLGMFIKSQTASKVELQSLLSPVIDKLKSVFDTVFAKVDLVKQKFSDARRLLADAMAKLDANDPAQARVIEEIKKQMVNIDKLEAKFSAAMHMLASKLDLAVVGLDKIITGVTSSIPGWGSIVGLAIDYLFMSDVKTLIQDLKARLLAL